MMLHTAREGLPKRRIPSIEYDKIFTFQGHGFKAMPIGFENIVEY